MHAETEDGSCNRLVLMCSLVSCTDISTLDSPEYKSKYAKLATCGVVEMNMCDRKMKTAERQDEIEYSSCPEPCEYSQWNVELASTLFPPSEEYFERFLKYQMNRTEPPTYAYARENIARVHIYYDELKIDRKVQIKAYELQSFIAEFGGTVDLLIGFSFFTVLQLIEIAVAICFRKLWYGRKNSNRDEDSSSSVIANPSTSIV